MPLSPRILVPLRRTPPLPGGSAGSLNALLSNDSSARSGLSVSEFVLSDNCPPRMRYCYTALLFLLFGVSSVYAQAPDSSVAMEVEMDSIEVTATPFRIANEATSFSASVRTRSTQDLNSTPSLSLEAITAGLPGLSVQSRTHFA